MEPVTTLGPGLYVTGDGLTAITYLIRQVKIVARRNGVPVPDMVIRMEQQVAAAIDAARTLDGRESSRDEYLWVTTTEWAQRRGCTERTARRHAQRHGHKESGRWMIPVKEK